MFFSGCFNPIWPMERHVRFVPPISTNSSTHGNPSYILQVYKAKTREGLDIALKVMRPGVTRLVACDWVCWFLALKLQRLMLGFWMGP